MIANGDVNVFPVDILHLLCHQIKVGFPSWKHLQVTGICSQYLTDTET